MIVHGCAGPVSPCCVLRGAVGLGHCVLCTVVRVYSYCALHARASGVEAVWCGVWMEKAGLRCFSKKARREVKP